MTATIVKRFAARRFAFRSAFASASLDFAFASPHFAFHFTWNFESNRVDPHTPTGSAELYIYMYIDENIYGGVSCNGVVRSKPKGLWGPKR